MGQVIIPDEALSNDQVHGLMQLIHEKLGRKKKAQGERRRWIMTGAFFMLLYGCSLRGHEGLFLEASDFVRLISAGKDGIKDTQGKVYWAVSRQKWGSRST